MQLSSSFGRTTGTEVLVRGLARSLYIQRALTEAKAPLLLFSCVLGCGALCLIKISGDLVVQRSLLELFRQLDDDEEGFEAIECAPSEGSKTCNWPPLV